MLNARIASAGLFAFCIAGTGTTALLSLSASAHAQDAATAPPAASAEPYFAIVTADGVYVRSAPSVQSSYPFGKLKRGDVVRVSEESFGWARVQTEGAAFAQIYGVVPADSRVSVSEDGKTLSVNAKSELRAPNISTPNAGLEASWKQIARLEPGATLSVVDRVDGERDSIYRVALPPVAEGWVNMNFLRKASQAEAAAFSAPASAQPATPDVIAAADVVSQQVQAPMAAPADGATTTDAADIAGPAAPMDATGTSTGTDVIVSGDAGPAPAAKPARPTKTPEQMAWESRRATMADLENLYTGIRGQSKAEAELGALRGRYLDLASQASSDAEIRAKANGRAEQLRLEMEVQSRIVELERMKSRINGEQESIASVAKAIEARSEYTVVGVLNASLVYDGQRLPLLYRIQDPATGQTVAYVAPGPGFQLSTMLGNLLGVRGDKAYDEALRVDVITPRTVDILTARKES